jgi:hypothetical protein
VTISGIGTVDAKSGTTTVSPTQTTTYTLTAKNSTSTVNQTATVTVASSTLRIISFTATPVTIVAGQSTTLSWATDNASAVTISGVGTVANNGSQVVTPTATTTYVLTATSAAGQSLTSQVTVQVTSAPLPKILRFTVGPLSITSGNKATLVWAVENADTVTISGVGTVPTVGAEEVSPTATTSYTLTASNSAGQATAQTTLTVTTATVIPTTSVTVSSCRATPSTIDLGATTTLSFTQTGATTLSVSGLGNYNPNLPLTLKPTTTTTYTLTFADDNNHQATCAVTVTVNQPVTPPVATGPTVVISNSPYWYVQTAWAPLDGSRSSSPAGNTPLSYAWSVDNPNAQFLDSPNISKPNVWLTKKGTYNFTLTVTDSKGNTATGRIQVVCDPPNPSLNPPFLP